ncbi:PTS-dependent dihydroxyacetone kinase phosphotransferase subunit DhaM [Halostella sp. JP-L12]|uniref:dihydroxyacetone kinase phosphoryl donor subunit DhaM n=1 Tax=Halostella TaxID=1843185 RepID=UPI000EF83867|nr:MULTISPECIES: dihydroxyacetone kinase phosphoryl donor subunit DhaM [Halostella]NHN49630.1 PTS-dependent dihydroxyacetone kinase phosphotransferase subunit DhaM [Halostella sp. JP-L12]
MVGLLVVSHSADAARGISDIAAEMGGADAEIVPVGGDPDGGIGTSVPDIQDALEAMDAAEVVVLVDLGSAVMNAEMAVETSEKDVVVADAPILEGALNAAVEASSSKATLDSVRESAEEARDVSKT